jgi:hypothetical protein
MTAWMTRRLDRWRRSRERCHHDTSRRRWAPCRAGSGREALVDDELAVRDQDAVDVGSRSVVALGRRARSSRSVVALRRRARSSRSVVALGRRAPRPAICALCPLAPHRAFRVGRSFASRSHTPSGIVVAESLGARTGADAELDDEVFPQPRGVIALRSGAMAVPHALAGSVLGPTTTAGRQAFNHLASARVNVNRAPDRRQSGVFDTRARCSGGGLAPVDSLQQRKLGQRLA